MGDGRKTVNGAGGNRTKTVARRRSRDQNPLSNAHPPMTTRHIIRAGSLALALGVRAHLVHAQTPDTARMPTAAFTGRIRSILDSSAVTSADIRLIKVDSAVVRRDRRGGDSLEVFVDSTKTRVVVTDSVGAFALRALPAGGYLFDIRRIGFAPLRGAVAVDSTAVSATIYLEVVSRVLAKVVVTASSIDRVKEKLERSGFNDRYHSGLAGEFIERADILRRKPQKLEDILAVYGIHNATFRLDRMPMDFESIRDYPADLVLGIEIYRHGRPTEFNGTRSGPLALSGGSQGPLVLIWTFIP